MQQSIATGTNRRIRRAIDRAVMINLIKTWTEN